MADYNSSLPIRTETAGDASVKIVDGTITSQVMAVNSDGSLNITDNAGSLTVDGTVELGATTLAALETITVTATDLDIRDLVFATDKVDVSGSSVELGATTLAALESVTVQNAGGASAVNIQDGGNSITVDGTVSLTSPGTSVADYNTAAAVAAAASSTHTYTAVGNFTLTQIEASGSGKMKIVVAVNGVTKFVQFNSTAQTNMTITLANPLSIVATQTITIVRTNLDKQAQDLYSTVCGYI